MNDRPATTAYPIAVLAGIATAASLPPWGWWPLAIAGAAGLAYVGRATSRRRRAGLTAAWAVAWFAPACAWMVMLTAAGYPVAIGLFALLHVAAAVAVPPSAPVWSWAAAHTAVEALRLSWPFGGVPLASLGIAQASGPLLGVARIGGVLAITWCVFAVGGVIASTVSGSSPTRRPMTALTATVVGALVVSASAAPRGTDTGDVVQVAVVQGGGAQGTTALDVPASKVTAAHLDATATVDPGVDLVVWPENTIDVDDFALSAVRAAIASEAARIGAPITVGVTEEAAAHFGDPTLNGFVNAQYVVAPDGSLTTPYVKVVRVPFGEYVPLRDTLSSIGVEVPLIPRDAVAGRGPAVIDIEGVGTAAVAISWEIFFGRRARNGVLAGGEVLVNPTNGSSYTWTILQTQQVASSRLRAVETGRWVLQAAPTGFSAIIDNDGQVLARTGISETAVLRDDIELRRGHTLYTRLGDGPIVAIIVLAALAPAIAAAVRAAVALRVRGSRSPARR